LAHQKYLWEEQVQISVANKIPFIATNGGHGPKVGQGQFTGINVNLASFNKVSIDTTNNLVTIGAGVKLWDVQKGLYDIGKEIRTFLLFGLHIQPVKGHCERQAE
jgi:FAD/FMN-containing dehydrogenase